MCLFRRCSVSNYLVVVLIYVAISGFSTVSAAPTFGNQSSDLNVKWDFDFVETFDGLQDWVRTEGRVGNVGDVSRMPKLLDGSDSAWGYYSMWGDGRTPPDNWIGSHDYEDNLVWRGTKSAAIDIGETAYGPSRLGFHMGEGYNEFYLFFMVNIPKNEFPTSCEGGSCQAEATGIYTPGETYAWYSSWKFTTFNMDCPSAMCPERNTYSDYWAILSHVKQYNYGNAPGITLHVEADKADGVDPNTFDKWASDGDMNLNPYLGDWFGLEYHVTQHETTTDWDIWFYDQEGNATKLMDNKTWPTPAAAQGRLWNQIFFGGNNSGVYLWGSTMKSPYYIDDVIVDDKRIGPKYFSLIHSDNPEQHSVADDFGGDGKADILLRNTSSGQLYLYEMDGNGHTGSNIGALSADWIVQGIGDFGGDGKADILLRNSSSGQLYLYEMDGNSVTPSNIGALSKDWMVQGVGDFGGDGKDDILLRNSSNGQLYLYEMDANRVTPSNIGVLNVAWTVQGVGDFGGDGKDDILLRNTSSGQLYLYEMNGNSVTPSNIGALSKDWMVQGVGDFGGDGKDDILLRNSSSGQLYLYEMDGNSVTPSNIGALSTAWTVERIADYGGDGKADILIRNGSSGQLYLFEMDRNSVTPSNIGALSTSWAVEVQ